MPEQRDPDRVCGANTDHGPCQQWKGANTPHLGIGACALHGGCTPNHVISAEREQVRQRMRTYGEPIDTDPKTALLGEVKRTAGHVHWLGQVVGDLEHQDGSHTQLVGAFGNPSTVVKLYQDERQHLARTCKMALDAGVEERLLDLAQQEMQLFGQLIKAIFSDPALELTPEQQQLVPAVVKRHLSSVA